MGIDKLNSKARSSRTSRQLYRFIGLWCRRIRQLGNASTRVPLVPQGGSHPPIRHPNTPITSAKLCLKTFHTQALPSNQSCAYFTGSFWALNVLIFTNCLEHNRSYILFITSVYEKHSLNFEKWSNASNYIYKVQNQGMKLCKPLGVPHAYREFKSKVSKCTYRKRAQVGILPTQGIKGTRQGHGTQRKWKTQTFHY